MKQTLILFFLITSIQVLGQLPDSTYPTKDGIINYSEIIKVDSLNKNGLYINAKKWIVNNYKSAKKCNSTR